MKSYPLKSMTTAAFLISVLLSLNNQALAFGNGDEFVVVSSYSVYPLIDGACRKDSVLYFCSDDEFSIVDIVDGTVKVKKTKSGDFCDDFAYSGNIYCFDEIVLSDRARCELKSEQKKVKFGGFLTVLTVPFKFDPESFKVFPSGQIGGFGGAQFSFVKREFEFGIGGIAGASTIPLNDLNSTSASDIKSVAGVTFGGGIEINIWRGFSFGVVYAVDLYNVDNTPYNRDWLSFGIGYNFFSMNKDQTLKKQITEIKE